MKTAFTDDQLKSAAAKIDDLKNHFTDDELHLISNALVFFVKINARIRNGASWRDASVLGQPDQPKPFQHSPASPTQGTTPNQAQAQGVSTQYPVIHLCADSNQLTASAPFLAPQITSHPYHPSITPPTTA